MPDAYGRQGHTVKFGINALVCHLAVEGLIDVAYGRSLYVMKDQQITQHHNAGETQDLNRL